MIWISILLFNLIIIYFIIEKTIGFRSLISNLTKRGLKDINSHKIEVVRDWEYIKANGLLLKSDEIDSFCEQYIVRKIMCEECVRDGKCVDCGCEIIGLMSTPSSKCSLGNWSEIKNPIDWDEYKNNVLDGLKLGFQKID